VESIYIIAHSEGTVVSFKGLLSALAEQKDPNNEWVSVNETKDPVRRWKGIFRAGE
jgi:esterase/lipase superfamily enzyme